jgi:HEAT repeat protein
MSSERELVQRFGIRGSETEVLRGLVGGATATHLRTATVSDAAFAALLEGLQHPNPRVRWWCIQVLDHVPDPRAVNAVAVMLDDPVARVRRNAAPALGCVACKPEWDSGLPDSVTAKLTHLAEEDASAKVRNEARMALACRLS